MNRPRKTLDNVRDSSCAIPPLKYSTENDHPPLLSHSVHGKTPVFL